MAVAITGIAAFGVPGRVILLAKATGAVATDGGLQIFIKTSYAFSFSISVHIIDTPGK
jgi:hypothetical protein